MKSLWNDADAAQQPELAGLVYMSRLVGADTDLVVWGGGNTSAKVDEADFRGRPARVLRVKGSGSDLKTIQLRDFPGVRLDDALALRERREMGDAAMVAYLAHTLQEPSSPRPSIETLLHAFLPAPFVVHTHADAVLMLTNTPRGQEVVREALGAGAVWIPYQRPGFALSTAIAAAVEASPGAACAVLEKHGLITWGATAREAYERTVEVVSAAEGYVGGRTSPRPSATPPPRGAGLQATGVPGGVPPVPRERGPGGAGGGGAGHDIGAEGRRRVYAAIAPLLRGLAARTTPEGEVLAAESVELPQVLPAKARVVLRFDDSEDVLAFASDPEAGWLSQIGPATPDHLINTKRVPLYVGIDPHPSARPPDGPPPSPFQGEEEGIGGSGLRPEPHSGFARDPASASAEPRQDRTADLVEATTAAITAELEPAWRAWVADYVAYVKEGSPNTPAPAGELVDMQPRVVLLPGVGMVTLGRDGRAARIAGEIYHHAVATIRGAKAVGGYASLSPRDCYDVEFWPLELYKLTLAPPEKALARRVAVVTGAASGIGRAIAERLAADGAHVVILDKNREGARTVAESIGGENTLAVETDVTDEASVVRAFEAAVLAYGGVDIVVSNAGLSRSHPVEQTPLEEWDLLMDVLGRGYFLVAREAFRVWKRQGIGGSLIFVASKNALVGGRDNVPYSAAKAAELHMARCLAEEGGPHRIRVNTVCPDAVLQGSGIWTSEWKEERARTYGISTDELDDFYRKRTTLKVNVFPADIAEAAHFFASDRSAKTTGGVLTVDGGVAAAYVR